MKSKATTAQMNEYRICKVAVYIVNTTNGEKVLTIFDMLGISASAGPAMKYIYYNMHQLYRPVP